MVAIWPEALHLGHAYAPLLHCDVDNLRHWVLPPNSLWAWWIDRHHLAPCRHRIPTLLRDPSTLQNRHDRILFKFVELFWHNIHLGLGCQLFPPRPVRSLSHCLQNDNDNNCTSGPSKNLLIHACFQKFSPHSSPNAKCDLRSQNIHVILRNIACDILSDFCGARTRKWLSQVWRRGWTQDAETVTQRRRWRRQKCRRLSWRWDRLPGRIQVHWSSLGRVDMDFQTISWWLCPYRSR